MDDSHEDGARVARMSLERGGAISVPDTRTKTIALYSYLGRGPVLHAFSQTRCKIQLRGRRCTDYFAPSVKLRFLFPL
jgi:hypothetical protein